MTKHPLENVQIRIHPIFALLICLSVWTGYFVETLTLFVLIFLHELGHATAAWSYGWKMKQIQLLPFGGVIKTDEWGVASNKEEIVVALAGPFYHVFLIIMSLLFCSLGIWSKEWTAYFIQGNLIIAGFNLLPIYPLDGGRIMQALCSCFQSYRQAFMTTIVMSVCFSLLLLWASFCIPGSVVHLPLFVIAVFLLVSNLQSIKQVHYYFLRFLLHRKERGISHAALIKNLRVRMDEPLTQVMKKWCKDKYHVIEIIDHQGRCVAYVPEERVLEHYFYTSGSKRVMEDLIS